MKIKISAESTIDMQKDLLDKFDISVLPYKIIVGDKELSDEDGIGEKIYDYVSKNKVLPKTSAINEEEYKDYFEELLKENDVVIHFCLSSHFSSAYSHAVEASKFFKLQKVYVIDSENLSTGIALSVIYAKKLADKGLDPELIVQKVERVKKFVRASFILDTLEYMHKGGRCSSFTLFGANLLKIKPQISVIDGKMEVTQKPMGRLNSVLEKYCDNLFVKYKNPDLENVFITHSSKMPEIEAVITEKLKAMGFKNIYNTMANGTVCSHCAPNCLGVLFIDREGLENEY